MPPRDVLDLEALTAALGFGVAATERLECGCRWVYVNEAGHPVGCVDHVEVAQLVADATAGGRRCAKAVDEAWGLFVWMTVANERPFTAEETRIRDLLARAVDAAAEPAIVMARSVERFKTMLARTRALPAGF